MTTDLHAQIAEDIEAAQYREALRTIDREDLRDPLASVLRARAWMGLERFSDAHREVSGVLAMQIDNATRLTADQVKLKCLGLMATVEDALAAALALVDNALACESPADAVEANLAAAWHYARKQCRPLVDATLAKARELDQAAHEIDHLEGFILLMFDERLAAIAAYERARSAPGDDAKSARIRRSARCGLARVHYLLGDFAAAHRELDAISPLASSDIRTRRGRIEILAAEKRWGEVVAILRRDRRHLAALRLRRFRRGRTLTRYLPRRGLRRGRPRARSHRRAGRRCARRLRHRGAAALDAPLARSRTRSSAPAPLRLPFRRAAQKPLRPRVV